jgi:hypothetical protein
MQLCSHQPPAPYADVCCLHTLTDVTIYRFESNFVKTSRYTVVTFIPLNLFIQVCIWVCVCGSPSLSLSLSLAPPPPSLSLSRYRSPRALSPLSFFPPSPVSCLSCLSLFLSLSLSLSLSRSCCMPLKLWMPQQQRIANSHLLILKRLVYEALSYWSMRP